MPLVQLIHRALSSRIRTAFAKGQSGVLVLVFEGRLDIERSLDFYFILRALPRLISVWFTFPSHSLLPRGNGCNIGPPASTQIKIL